MHYIVTFKVSIPQPYDDEIKTITRRFPQYLTNYDGVRMAMDKQAMCCLVLAEFPSASVELIAIKQG